MERKLPTHEEALVTRFHCHLQRVRTVDDIFPPDSGVLEPLTPPLPGKPGAEAISLAAVYDLCIARQRREAMRQQGAAILESIDNLVSV